MPGAAKNQNFSFGGEFDCVAIPGKTIDMSRATGQVVNEGFVSDAPLDVTTERQAELSAWSSQRLIEYVNQVGYKLTIGELKYLFRVALDRLSSGRELPASLLLSQALMDAATSRMRS